MLRHSETQQTSSRRSPRSLKKSQIDESRGADVEASAVAVHAPLHAGAKRSRSRSGSRSGSRSRRSTEVGKRGTKSPKASKGASKSLEGGCIRVLMMDAAPQFPMVLSGGERLADRLFGEDRKAVLYEVQLMKGAEYVGSTKAGPRQEFEREFASKMLQLIDSSIRGSAPLLQFLDIAAQQTPTKAAEDKVRIHMRTFYKQAQSTWASLLKALNLFTAVAAGKAPRATAAYAAALGAWSLPVGVWDIAPVERIGGARPAPDLGYVPRADLEAAQRSIGDLQEQLRICTETCGSGGSGGSGRGGSAASQFVAVTAKEETLESCAQSMHNPENQICDFLIANLPPEGLVRFLELVKDPRLKETALILHANSTHKPNKRERVVAMRKQFLTAQIEVGKKNAHRKHVSEKSAEDARLGKTMKVKIDGVMKEVPIVPVPYVPLPALLDSDFPAWYMEQVSKETAKPTTSLTSAIAMLNKDQDRELPPARLSAAEELAMAREQAAREAAERLAKQAIAEGRAAEDIAAEAALLAQAAAEEEAQAAKQRVDIKALRALPGVGGSGVAARLLPSPFTVEDDTGNTVFNRSIVFGTVQFSMKKIAKEADADKKAELIEKAFSAIWKNFDGAVLKDMEQRYPGFAEYREQYRTYLASTPVPSEFTDLPPFVAVYAAVKGGRRTGRGRSPQTKKTTAKSRSHSHSHSKSQSQSQSQSKSKSAGELALAGGRVFVLGSAAVDSVNILLDATGSLTQGIVGVAANDAVAWKTWKNDRTKLLADLAQSRGHSASFRTSTALLSVETLDACDAFAKIPLAIGTLDFNRSNREWAAAIAAMDIGVFVLKAFGFAVYELQRTEMKDHPISAESVFYTLDRRTDWMIEAVDFIREAKLVEPSTVDAVAERLRLMRAKFDTSAM